MDHDRIKLKDAIHNILQQHQGPEDCITMIELHHRSSGEVIVPWRKYDQTRITRSIIEQLRREGVPVGNRSGSEGGYFLARNDEELKPTINVFHARAMSSLGQEAALKRMPFEELLRQYELELQQETEANG